MRRGAALDLVALALLAGLALALCWPFVLGGQAFYFYDSNCMMMPLLKWSHQSLAAGVAPAWDATSLCGMSVLDGSLSVCLYPPLRLLAGAFDAADAMGLLILTHLVLAAWGVYVLVRQRGHAAGPALVAAVVAAFAGGMLNSPPGWPMFISQAWFPWMLLGLALCQDPQADRRTLGAAVLGLATGCCFLGGYPGMGFYALGVLTLLHAWWLLARPRTRVREAGPWAALLMAAAIATLLYGGQALALRRGAAASARGHGLSVEEAEDSSLSPAVALGLVLPHGLGRRADDSFSGASWRFGTFEPTGLFLYVGLGGLLLLGLGLRRQPRQALPYAVAWALLIFYGLGRYNPVYPWLLRLPVLGYLRAPDKAVLFAGTLAAVPVALGVESLGQRRRGPAWAALAMALALGAAWLALALGWGRLIQAGDAHIQAKILGDPLHHLGLEAYRGRLLRLLLNLRWQLALQGLWAALLAAILWLAWRGGLGGRGLALALAALCFGELAVTARTHWMLIDRSYYAQPPASAQWLLQHQDPQQPTRTLSWGYLEHLRRVFPDGRPAGRLQQELALREVMEPNIQRDWGLDYADGYAPLWPTRLQPLLGWIRSGDADLPVHGLERLRAARAALDLSATRWVLSGTPLDLPGFVLRRDGDVRIYENLRALPMAYIAQRSAGQYDAATAWAALSGPASPESRWPRPALLEDGSAPDRGDGQVRWLVRRDDDWELEAHVDTAAGVLVLARAYYPGPWVARVDGRPAELLPANAAFCALKLGPGTHRVSVVYQDPILERAQRWELAGALLALGLLAWAWRMRGESE